MDKNTAYENFQQVMLEKDEIKILLIYSKKCLNIYTSFDPFFHFSFLQRIHSTCGLSIKIACNAGVIFTNFEKTFDSEEFEMSLREFLEGDFFEEEPSLAQEVEE